MNKKNFYIVLSLLVVFSLSFMVKNPQETIPFKEALLKQSFEKAKTLDKVRQGDAQLTSFIPSLGTSAKIKHGEESLVNTAKSSVSKILAEQRSVKKIPLKKIALEKISLNKISFQQLPGWKKADVKKSLLAFQRSCQTFLNQDPAQPVGSKHIHLKAKDWQPACKAAKIINPSQEKKARVFFEQWFYPVEFSQKRPMKGLFTGYYMPQIKGSLTKTSKYDTPIYGLPEDLKWDDSKQNDKKKTYYTRAEIDQGRLKKKAPVIAWIDSPIDRLFLEIEGSGVITLGNGKHLYLNYAGENGAPYTSIGSVLIKQGVMTKDTASKTAIHRYLEEHPQKVNTILHQNQSFVFFQNLKKAFALGAQGMALTPGYSLAIDTKWIPLGAPLWLSTKIPSTKDKKEKQFKRLMIAQDTGGAIRGLIRGDIFWGAGKKANFLGEHMKNMGNYWLLLPKHTFQRFSN